MLKIGHLSDIQIRNLKRHWEFKESFQHLYKSLKEEKPDIIVLAGDIAHTKAHISPEFVQMCVDFFKNLSSIAPLYIIPGNHDGIITNQSRLDALTPIVNAIKSKNIHYYKDSGVYPAKVNDRNFNFVVFSCFDDQEDWPTAEDVDKRKLNIGIYHGMINDAMLQNNFKVDNEMDLDYFMDKVDYLLLGDIHEYQALNKEITAAYCGSYPQQNFGESLDKGYLLWDIKSKKKHDISFVKLPNVCPYYTIKLGEDLIVPEDLDFKSGSRIRVQSRQLNIVEKREIEEVLKKAYAPRETRFVDEVNAHRQDIDKRRLKAKIENIYDINVQERLIKNFLKSEGLSKKELEKVLDMNKKYDTLARRQDDVLRNAEYRLGKMSFSNLFSYGEDNSFDFSKNKGILGVFGKNAVGKSSLVIDIPLYNLFNKISKKGVVKNDLLINEKKNYCESEMEIFVDNDLYKIKRRTDVYLKSGKRKKNPVYQGKTSVSFKVYDKDGNEYNKDGEERLVTDDNIRRTFGKAEDFMMTSVAPQWQLLNFIECGSTERQKLIGRYFDIDIFETKYQIANERKKELVGVLKTYKDRNFTEEFHSIADELALLKAKKEKLDNKLETIVERLGEITESAAEKAEEIQIISHVRETKEELLEKKREVVESLKKIRNEVSSLTKKMEKVKLLTEEREKILAENPEVTVENYKELNKSVEKLEEIAKTREEKIKRLGKYECISNKNCCMRKEMEVEKEKRKDILTEIKKNKKEMAVIDIVTAKSDVSRIKKMNKEINSFGSLEFVEKNLKDKMELFDLKNKLGQEVGKSINLLKENSEKAKRNAKISLEIKELEKEKSHLVVSEDETRDAISYVSARTTSLKEKFKDTKAQYDKYKEYKEEFESYTYFLKAMSKDGLPKQIIENNLHIINSEIKKILANNVNFTIVLEGGDIYFNYSKGQKRKIELSSGMEKTVAAIAIRAALLGVTTLPKSNIFVLDEVFGSLDSEYIDAVSGIFEYLKTLFECIVIVTHIDAFKDIVDHSIVIERDDEGFAKISQ